MNDRDREVLINRLRNLVEHPGVRLDTPTHWVVEGIKDPAAFFKNLSPLMGVGATLYLEGTTIHPEAATFYLAHEAVEKLSLAYDCLFPVPDIYHLKFSPQLADDLADLVARRRIHELFNHLKAYQSGQVIFEFHDAFEGGGVRISEIVSEKSAASFAQALRAQYSRENTTKAGPDSLRAMLNATEHPEKVKIARVSWWRDFVDSFIGGYRGR